MQFFNFATASIWLFANVCFVKAISPPTIVLPDASTVWTAGTMGNVTWNIPSGATSQNLVSISLYRNSVNNGRLPVIAIVQNVKLNSGTVNWNVPIDLAAGGDYIVRINDGPNLASSPAFTIKAIAVSVITSIANPSSSGASASATGVKNAGNATTSAGNATSSAAALAYSRSGNTFWLSVLLTTTVATIAVFLL